MRWGMREGMRGGIWRGLNSGEERSRGKSEERGRVGGMMMRDCCRGRVMLKIMSFHV